MTAIASASHLRAHRASFALPAAGAVAVAGACAVVVATGDVVVRPGWFAAFSAYNVLAFTGAAFLWLRLRPSSRVGFVLLALAALAAMQSLQGSSSSVALSIGVLTDPVAVVLWAYLLVTFPASRLSRPGATVLLIAVATIAVGFIPSFFFSSHIAGATPLARCTAACPPNAFVIANRPGVATHFADAEEVGLALFASACVLLLLVRLLVAAPPRRRLLAPVHAVGIMWAVAFGAYGVSMNLIVTDPRVWDTIGWVLTGARVALPLAFVLAIASTRVFAGAALGRMVAQLPDRPTAAALQRVAANVLGDRALRLAFQRSDGVGWIGVDGAPAGPPSPGSGRSWREVRAGNGHVGAALAYDEWLDDDPDLLDAATSAVKLSLDAVWLESELRASHEELRDSVERSVAIGEEQRRQLERDLHDTAQQRLVVIAMDIERLRAGLPPDAAADDAELMRLGGELELALDEIRDVGHGVFPPLLHDLGIRAALTEAVRGNRRVRLRISHLERYRSEVEAAMYFSTLEAIQNALKYATPTVPVIVSVCADAGEVCFEVRDEGPGFDPKSIRPDGGLAGLSHRLRAVGGNLEITSAPGMGTAVTGSVPVG